MKPEWKEFLMGSGAEFDEGELVGFGNRERETRASIGGNTLVDLSHDGLISVHGADAEQLLQGQLTNDVRQLADGRSQLAGICTHQGRMLALFRLFRHGDSIYLRLPRSMLEAVIGRLQMFVLMSDATVEDSSDTFARFGLMGPTAENELTNALGHAPAAVDSVLEGDGITAIRVPAMEGHQRYELYGSLDAMKTLWEKLNVNAAPVGPYGWALAEVLAGMPNVYPETAETFIPQMTNLQAINGISFDKGCYSGQEVIARMQYRGELKRRMFVFRASGQVVSPGTEVFAAGKASAAGKVVASACHPDGDLAGLVVMQLSQQEAALSLGSEDGPGIRLMPPPYALEAATDEENAA